jgi:thioesterase domain-containing protein
MFDVLAANYQAQDSYVPPVYPGKLTIFRTSRRDDESVFDYYYGWDKLASAGVEVHEITAVHWNLMQEPSVRLLAEQLTACFKKAQTESSLNIPQISGK